MATAHKRAFDRIRNAIFSGKYPPGYPLKEEELARELNVSRTPVRQAIRTLAEQGLVDIKSNKRSYVADVSEGQFEEMFDVLAYLESYSAGLAADKIPESAISRLKELNSAMEKTIASEDNSEFLKLNSEFHDLIHQYSGNEKVQDLVRRVIQFPHNLYLKFEQIPDTHNPESIVEHAQIIDALERRDKDYAVLRMRSHTESVRRAFRHLWNDEVD